MVMGLVTIVAEGLFPFLLGNFLAEQDLGVLLEHCKFLSLNGFAHEEVKTEMMLRQAAGF